jgi:glucose/arabinose dehydrogenase
MPARRFSPLVLLLVAVLVAAGCSDRDDSDESKASSTTRATTTTTSAGTTTTTTTATDLAAVNVKLTELAELERPVAMAIRKGDASLYVVEKPGRVRAIRAGQLVDQPVLDITDRVDSNGNEQGLLGLAFSPDATKLYVHYSSQPNGDTEVDEFTVAADGTVDAGSRRQVLTTEQPQSNHNGGELTFGPDGYLYLGLGDGGSAGDQGGGHASGGNGQSLGTLLGKLLRIDPTPSGGQPYTVPADNPFVNTAGARPEIWSYGLRNPWRFTFDKTTGDLWIGDVGQNAYEEIDFAARSAGGGKGVNYGWNVREGLHSFRDGDAPGAVDPVYELSHDGGNCSVTGGYVYRGTRIPALRGGYLFADYCGGQLRAIALENGTVAQERVLPVRASSITSFGQDGDGELYVLSDSGAVLRVDPA